MASFSVSYSANMRAYVEVFLQVKKYFLMLKVWVLKRREMYFILFFRTTVKSTERVYNKG